MNRINLLPHSELEARRRTRQIIWAKVGCACVLMLACVWAGAAWLQVSRLDHRIAMLDAELAPVREAGVRLAQLQVETASLDEALREYGRLSLPLSTSTILALLNERMPESIVLTSVVCTAPPADLNATQSQTRGRPAPAGISRPMQVTLEGIGQSDVEVGRFARNLSDGEAFEQVKLAHSREVRIGNAVLYEFRITFEVPTDRPVIVVEKREANHAG